MPLTPEERQIIAARLDLLELDRDPEYFAAWIQRNELTTALAHLAGTDGAKSYLLRCLATGVLRVALEDSAGTAVDLDAGGALPVALQNAAGDLLAIAADGVLTAELRSRESQLGSVLVAHKFHAHCPQSATVHTHAGGGVETFDSGSTWSRLVVITAMAAPVACYRSTGAGNKDTPIGICTAYGPLITAMEEQYLDLESTVAGIIHILEYATSGIS